jgi:hypothetical protein
MDLFEDDTLPAIDPFGDGDYEDGLSVDEEAPWFECDCDLCNGFDDFTRDEDGW